MTAQFSESLLYEGKRLSMQSQPLASYLESMPNPPTFQEVCTACWRGYVGTWEIINDHLYLVDLEAHWQDGEPVSLEQLFPDCDGAAIQKVFAHWYSGTLRCARGKLLDYVHMGYDSTYERSLLLSFDCGVLVKTNVEYDATPSSVSTP